MIGEKVTIIFFFIYGGKKLFSGLFYGEIPSLPSVENSFQTARPFPLFTTSISTIFFGRTFSLFFSILCLFGVVPCVGSTWALAP